MTMRVRDHWPKCFSRVWRAAASKVAAVIGSSDESGEKTVPVKVADIARHSLPRPWASNPYRKSSLGKAGR